MAYHGYSHIISDYCRLIFEDLIRFNINRPVKILEIGVDRGSTLFALNNNLNILEVPFEYYGIDILIQDHLPVINWTFHQRYQNNKINLIEENSLNYLKKCNEIFDVILIDGDHNYRTVSEELTHLDRISHLNTLVICDDYFGRWKDRDGFYADQPGYEEITIATKSHMSEKQGVNNAIDDFLKENKEYQHFCLVKGEPICMIKKGNTIMEIPDDCKLAV